jgi:cbb3-type cytochrome oxidase subunit 3
MSINSIRQNLISRSSKQIVLLALGLCLISLILITSAFRPQNQGNLAVAPPDFKLAARVDLAARSYDGETVAQLTLAETAVVHTYYILPNIDITYFDLSLKGADGDTYLILHSEDYQTDDNGGGEWEKHLSQGVYQWVLTAPQTTGTLSVYWTSK